MSHLPIEKVYQGFWTDHAKGRVLGATVTTSSNTATIVVAVLSILIKFAGTNLWQIIALLAFGAPGNIPERSGLHHQQQTLLRNVSSPSMMLPKAWKLYWYWRRHDGCRSSFARLNVLTTFATICSIGFIVAGVFSSQIVTTTDIEVLADSSSCGFTNHTAQLPALKTYARTACQDSIQYAHECYNGSRFDPVCQIYTTKSIPFNTSYEPCPFDGLCTLAKNQALNMDTGLLWSSEIFGINTRKADALGIRQVLRCAPLNLSQYEVNVPMDAVSSQRNWGRDPFPSENMTSLIVGPWADAKDNGTTIISSYNRGSLEKYTMSLAYWYNRGQEYFQQSPWTTSPGFEPIPPLRKTRGDLALIGLSANQLLYQQPVDDPFYAAHIEKIYSRDNKPGLTGVPVYAADGALNVVGCTQQYQFCKPGGGCTELTYTASATSQAAQMNLNPLQNLTLYYFANALINFNVGYYSLTIGSATPLLALDSRPNPVDLGLPPNQWELEVKYWTAIILAALQKFTSDFAVGQNLAEEDFSRIKLAPGPNEHILCHAQKMKAPSGITNISVFGLGITVGFSGLVIITNLTLLKVLRWVSGIRGERQWTAIKQWDEEEILHVQRKVFRGKSHWILE